jgi:hypothetical protein
MKQTPTVEEVVHVKQEGGTNEGKFDQVRTLTKLKTNRLAETITETTKGKCSSGGYTPRREQRVTQEKPWRSAKRRSVG